MFSVCGVISDWWLIKDLKVREGQRTGRITLYVNTERAVWSPFLDLKHSRIWEQELYGRLFMPRKDERKRVAGRHSWFLSQLCKNHDGKTIKIILLIISKNKIVFRRIKIMKDAWLLRYVFRFNITIIQFRDFISASMRTKNISNKHF